MTIACWIPWKQVGSSLLRASRERSVSCLQPSSTSPRWMHPLCRPATCFSVNKHWHRMGWALLWEAEKQLSGGDFRTPSASHAAAWMMRGSFSIGVRWGCHSTAQQKKGGWRPLAPKFALFWSVLNWLMVWNFFYFPIYWVANHPNWRTIFFRGVAKNHQPVNRANLILSASWHEPSGIPRYEDLEPLSCNSWVRIAMIHSWIIPSLQMKIEGELFTFGIFLAW